MIWGELNNLLTGKKPLFFAQPKPIFLSATRVRRAPTFMPVTVAGYGSRHNIPVYEYHNACSHYGVS